MNPLTRHAIAVAGASGLVGRALVAAALARNDVAALHLLLRRPLEPPLVDPRVQLQLVDFARLQSLPAPIDTALCALGTTIAQAGSQAAFRAVDFDAVLAFAHAARKAGARRMGVVSALGADARSRVFYNRVKGEAEAALRAVGFEVLVIARPSLLLGDRAALGQPARSGEGLAARLTAPVQGLIPLRWRPVRAEAVARSLLEATLERPAGTHVLDSAALQRGAARTGG